MSRFIIKVVVVQYFVYECDKLYIDIELYVRILLIRPLFTILYKKIKFPHLSSYIFVLYVVYLPIADVVHICVDY